MPSLMFRSPFLPLVLCCLGSMVTSAAARAPTATLQVESAPGCPDAARLIEAVETRLCRDVFVETPPSTFAVLVRFEDDGEHALAHVELRERTGASLGRRTLYAERQSCASLLRPVALAVALLVDSPQNESVITLPPEPPPAPTAIEASSRERIEETTWHIDVELGAAANLGAYGPLSIGGTFAAGVHAPELIELRARAQLTSSEAGISPERVAIVAFGGSLDVCLGDDLSPDVALGACAGASVFLVRGSGRGLLMVRSVELTNIALEATARLRVRLHQALWASLEVGAEIPLLRARFAYLAEGEIQSAWEPWPIAPLVRIGLLIRLPDPS